MHHGFRGTILLVASVLGCAALVSCTSAPHQQNVAKTWKPLNVVLITLDTVRPDHLHCYGYEKIKTPTIDALAESGVLFEKALTQAPITAPSHASMLTGTNPNIHGVRDNGFALQPSSATLATILRQHGWITGGFVSTSILSRHFGFSQGFDTYDDTMLGTANPNDEAARPANITVDHAIEWLRTQPRKPFFLWVHLYDAHKPYHPPAQFRKQYPGDPYDAEIAFEDQQVGRLVEAVRQKAPDDKTVIILLSDHGESLGQHGEYEHGIFLYDSTLRIAWIMEGPGVPAGIRIEQQAREIDLLPTILNLLGGTPSQAVQGTSMAPAFHGHAVNSNVSYEETLIPKFDMGWAELKGIHTAHWMYVRAPRPELYDLDRDPGETDNVIRAHPKEYRELASELKELSGAGSSSGETVTMKQLDRPTMEQLKSLGYVADFSARKIELNGKGDDPKDHVATMKALETIASIKNISHAREIELLRQALKNDPANPTLFSWLIDAYGHSGQSSNAIQACLDDLHYNPHDGEVLSRLAGFYLRQGNVKEAIDYYRQAAQLEPLDVEGQNNLATAYLQSGRMEDAERVFRWVLDVQPYAPAFNGLGIVADNRNDVVAARQDFERAVELDPTYVEAQLNLGIVCMRTRDLPCARTAFRAFIANAPKNATKTYGRELTQAKAALSAMSHPGR